MLQLIYMSRMTGDPARLDVAALAEPSRRNNRAAEITGVLIRRGPFFCHVMEGPRTAVEDTFLRIIRDPLHDSLTVLSRRPVAWREFGPYAMSDTTSRGEQDALLERISPYIANSAPGARAFFAELIRA